MAKGGRPTKYREEYDEQVYKLCLLGATDEQLADFFEVAVSTIYEWEKAQPGFSEARKKGKEVADANVAEALYHRALGYEHDAVKITSDGDYFPYVKRYPPDTAAAFIWLKNRAGWKDKQDVEHSGKIEGGVLMVPQAESDEWDDLAKRRQAVLSENGHGPNGDGGG